MMVDDLILSAIYLAASFILFWIGKLAYDLTTPSYQVKEELVEKDNAALALALVGYYFGLVLAIGGVMSGDSRGLEEDLIDIAIYGPLTIVLLNVSRILNDRLILRKFKVRDELIRDQNKGTAVVVLGTYVATGLVINGAVSGIAVLDTTSTIISAVIFWALSQIGFVIASLIYDAITSYDVHDQIEKDNVAAGIAFGGALIALGNILRHAASGDLIAWTLSLQDFAIELALGLVLLPIVRFLSDKVLLPGRNLTDEIVNQEHPNIGAAYIEAFSYIGASLLIVWSL
ncbi:MAG: DUF350 domain-containing protein [Gemmatimonadetes bacterium]|nr:DUF350 domain-containing protein [Gemmatimonadota bacterium]|tara:strand:+ start:1442 stop:2302 length:861 start_codon:yes stop_codon:yes gene_type:complete